MGSRKTTKTAPNIGAEMEEPTSVVSSTEVTGLLPALPATPADAEAHDDIAHIHPAPKA